MSRLFLQLGPLLLENVGLAFLLQLAELNPSDLAADRLWQLVDKLDRAGSLVRRRDLLEVGLDVGDELLLGVLVASDLVPELLRQDNERLDDLASAQVRRADGGRFGDGRVGLAGRSRSAAAARLDKQAGSAPSGHSRLQRDRSGTQSS